MPVEPTQLTTEPKFGRNKDFVSFADLAMKSMAFGSKMIEKPARPEPKKKRISVRLSIDQSNIEDTPVLAALQAAKEDLLAAQPPAEPADNITELTYVHGKDNRHGVVHGQAKESEADDGPTGSEELTGSLKLLVGEHATEEEKSRATRSRLHVATIGLSSSTLGMYQQNIATN